MKNYLFILWSVILGLFFWTSYSSAAGTDNLKKESELLPRWELGAMGLGAYLPHYPGSDEYYGYAFPLPYFVYRGEVLRANREGLRTIFFRGGGFESSVSFFGNPPVPDDNKARQGMGGLDAIGEVGPALRYYFYEYGERDDIYLQANFRGAVSANFDDFIDLTYRGLRGELSLIFQNDKILEAINSRIHLSGGVSFSDERLNDYYYEVPAEAATETRSEYDAGAGYSGLNISASLVTEFTDDFWVGGYCRLNNYSGAVFADSPLVKDENNWVLGVMVIWVLTRSDELVR